MRVTLHLTDPDRELLQGIEQRSDRALAEIERAHRDYLAAACGMAASRGLRGVSVVGLTERGLVVELAPPAESPTSPESPERSHAE